MFQPYESYDANIFTHRYMMMTPIDFFVFFYIFRQIFQPLDRPVAIFNLIFQVNPQMTGVHLRRGEVWRALRPTCKRFQGAGGPGGPGGAAAELTGVDRGDLAGSALLQTKSLQKQQPRVLCGSVAYVASYVEKNWRMG